MAPDSPAEKGACVVSCGDCKAGSEDLTCRIYARDGSQALECEGRWDAESERVFCSVPSADTNKFEAPEFDYDVVDAAGRVVCKSTGVPSGSETTTRTCCEPQIVRRPAAAAAAATKAAAANKDAKAAGGADFGRRAGEDTRAYLKREYSALKPFVIISSSYLLFTITDGAVRMIVLLHAYNLGFSAWQVAIMFTLYELAGVVTNLAAGFMGARWGIRWTLLTGLTLQLAGIGMLFGWQTSWVGPEGRSKAIVFVTAAQMLCGVAKDLTKLGGKTVTKLVTPDERQGRLFKIVSFITGFKNSLKGFGYFLGAACLTFNYYFALSVLLFLILLAMPWAALGLDDALGRARKENVTLRQLLRQKHNVNVLSAARFFLFGCRDLWFEVPLPFFLRDATYGVGWSRIVVGAVLACFIIGYGQVQSWTPQLVLAPLRQSPANKYVEVLWNTALTAWPAYLAALALGSPAWAAHDVPVIAGTLMSGLAGFAVVFAINSSVHSYLIVRYSEGDKVAMNVGWYYMANAMGRLTGTLVSGALYSFTGATVVQGLGYCFVASVAFSVISTAITMFIRDDSGGLQCGPRLRLVKAPAPAAAGKDATAAAAPTQAPGVVTASKDASQMGPPDLAAAAASAAL